MYGLDVCLEKMEVESVIKSQPGGPKLLRSDERLLWPLGNGIHYQIGARDEKALHVVKYRKEQLDKIKRVIAYAELNVKQIPPTKITDAIMRSFTRDNYCSMPPMNQSMHSKLTKVT